ncbi:DUF4349 domain-containing protein [Neosynechococcus sphagnicola]|uniref:DUF4349 domain-containing protein n=1 Tax=Neosynechococcus sphagnicola TaxID=1501145 RepID=UPI001EF9DA10|nr:DUF4349 domain-containing protein [Neosynechococcus sphagnicola]
MRAATQVVKTQQGDILGLQSQTLPNDPVLPTVSLQIRVPAERLDATLAQLSQLGTVTNQRLTAEDVSDQLVDFDARLRNLRKTEETLLQIMERSGSVADVLKVAQELSNTRQAIEQTAAQLHRLNSQVAYSNITVVMEALLPLAPKQRSLAVQLQETWDRAVQSMGNLTIDLSKLGIWLIAYTPYWVILGLGIVWGRRTLRRRRMATTSPPIPPCPPTN